MPMVEVSNGGTLSMDVTYYTLPRNTAVSSLNISVEGDGIYIVIFSGRYECSTQDQQFIYKSGYAVSGIYNGKLTGGTISSSSTFQFAVFHVYL